MMAGDCRILKNLKEGWLIDITADVEEHLKHCRENINELLPKDLSSYGMFALQFLHGSVLIMDSLKPTDVHHLMSAVKLCSQCLQATRQHVKLKDPLTEPKCLVNLLSKLVKRGFAAESIEIGEILYINLTSISSPNTAYSGYVLLWNAALTTEKDKQNREQALKQRTASLELLTLSDKELSFFVEKTFTTATWYTDLIPQKERLKSMEKCLNIFDSSRMFLVNCLNQKEESKHIEACLSYVELQLNLMQYLLRYNDIEQFKIQDIIRETLGFLAENKNRTKGMKELSEMVKVVMNVCEFCAVLKNIVSVVWEQRQQICINVAEKLKSSVQYMYAHISYFEKNIYLLSVICKAFHISRQVVEKSVKQHSDTDYGYSEEMFLSLDQMLDMFCESLRMQETVLTEKLAAKSLIDSTKTERLLKLSVVQDCETRSTQLFLYLCQLKQLKEKEALKSSILLQTSFEHLSELRDVVKKAVSMQQLTATEHHNLGIMAARFGHLCHNNEVHDMACNFYTIMCEQFQVWCDFDEKLKDSRILEVKLGKRYECLAKSQQFCNNYQAALKSTVKSLLIDPSHMTPACETFVKIKRDMVKQAEHQDTSERLENSLYEALIKENPNLEHKYLSDILMAELSHYKSLRTSLADHQMSTVKQLLAMCNDPQQEAYLLLEQAMLTWSFNWDEDRSPEDCCQTAVNILNDLLGKLTPIGTHKNGKKPLRRNKMVPKKHPGLNATSITSVKDDLARAYFVMYLCQSDNLNKNSREKVENSEDTKEVIYLDKPAMTEHISTNQNQEDDSSKMQDEEYLLPGPCFTVNMEYSSMENLDHALGLWEIVAQGGKLSEVRNLTETIGLLQVISAKYRLAARSLHEYRALSTLLQMTRSQALQTEQMMFMFRQIQLLLSMNLVSEAQELTTATRKKLNLEFELSSNPGCYMMLADAYIMFYAEKYHDSWDILTKIQTILSSKDKTKTWCIIELKCKSLQSQLCTISELYSTVTPPAGCWVDSASDVYRLSSGIMLYLKENEVKTQMEQWSAAHDVLQAALDLGRVYTDIGDARSAKCYLNEGLKLSQTFKAPRRTTMFLQELAKLDMICGKGSDAEAKCKAAQFLLNSDLDMFKAEKPNKKQQKSIECDIFERKNNKKLEDIFTINTPDKNSDKSRKNREDCFGFNESDEDIVMQSQPITAEEEFGDESGTVCDLTSSPALKRSTSQLPKYSTHSSKCACNICSDILLHSLNLHHFVLEAECLQQENSLARSGKVLDQALKLHKICKNKADKAVKYSGIVTNNVTLYADIVAQICLKLADLSFHQRLPRLVTKYVSETRNFLKTSRNPTSYTKINQLVEYILSLDATTKLIADFEYFTPNDESCVISESKIPLATKEGQMKANSTAPRKVRSKTKQHGNVVIFEDDVTEATFKTPAKPKNVPKITVAPIQMVSYPPKGISKRVAKLKSLMIDSDDEDIQDMSLQKSSVKPSSKSTAVKSTRRHKPAKSKAAPSLKLTTTFASPLSAVDMNSPLRSPVKRNKSSKTAANKSASNHTKSINLDCVQNVYDFATESPIPNALKSKMKAPKAQRKTRSRIAKHQPGNPDVELFRTEDNDCDGLEILTEIPEIPENQTSETSVADFDSIENVESHTQVQMKLCQQSKAYLRDSALTAAFKTSSKHLYCIGSNTRNSKETVRIQEKTKSKENEDDGIILLESDLCGFDHELDTQCNDSKELQIFDNDFENKSDGAKSDIVCEPVLIENILDVPVLDNSSIEAIRGGSDEENCDPVQKKVRTRGRGKGDCQLNKKEVIDDLSGKLAQVTLTGDNLESMKTKLINCFNSIRCNPPAVMYRNVCQSLIAWNLNSSNQDAAYYLTESLSVTFRHTAIASIGNKIRKLKKESASNGSYMCQEVKKLIECRELLAFNKTQEDFREAINTLPEDWTVCQISLLTIPVCSGNELVVTRCRRGQEPTVVHVPGSKCKEAVIEFNKILSASKETMKVSDRAQWWSERRQQDSYLQILLNFDMEQCIGCWKGVLLGIHKNEDDAKKLYTAAKEMKAECDAVSGGECSLQLIEALIDCAHSLSEDELTVGICYLTSLSHISKEIHDLVTLIQRHNKKLNMSISSRHPVILVLDKAISQLPWESIPILRNHPVCRMPSLYFIQSHLRAMIDNPVYNDGVNTRNVYYVLNPDNNLSSTEETFKEQFRSKKGWRGLIARPPTVDELKEALTQHDLFVYCGHGSGSKYFSRKCEIQVLNVQAAAFLIGCSSSRLNIQGQLEGDGVVLNYLMAGCPAVLGNIWDVTDKDIDRFLAEVLKHWLPAVGSMSLLEAVCKSRDVCKVGNLVGAAPVVYGLPIYIKK